MNPIKICKINELLSENFDIPTYQRPYCWSKDNVIALLNDIENAYSKNDSTYRYRVGTIILSKKDDDNSKYDVVDGQQRIITFILLKKILKEEKNLGTLNFSFSSDITKGSIKRNYSVIENWFNSHSNAKKIISTALKNILEVVIIKVSTLEEAFQLFDSQNSRGKPLEPQDLLKAYHLRQIKNLDNIDKIANDWENTDAKEIKILLNNYMYPIRNWSNKKDNHKFGINDIDSFKGLSNNELIYNYALRIYKIGELAESRRFKLTEEFIAGKDFFKMISHYLKLREELEEKIKNNYEYIYNIINKSNETKGFYYVRNLFYATLLEYYDRFNIMDEIIVKKLFTWAFMLRVDLQMINADSINRYALGGSSYSYEWISDGRYTNNIPVFSIIKDAKNHTELYNVDVRYIAINENRILERYKSLYEEIKVINGDKNEI